MASRSCRASRYRSKCATSASRCCASATPSRRGRSGLRGGAPRRARPILPSSARSSPRPSRRAEDARQRRMSYKHVAVIGAGPAGLMAAEVLTAGGAPVTVYDHMPSAGRKFLMAGRGGLNLTHNEDMPAFLARYGTAKEKLQDAIEVFPPSKLRAWADELGAETFVGSSGRVFPKAMKAAPLLRAWLRQARCRTGRRGLRTRHRAGPAGGDAGALGCSPRRSGRASQSSPNAAVLATRRRQLAAPWARTAPRADALCPAPACQVAAAPGRRTSASTWTGPRRSPTATPDSRSSASRLSPRRPVRCAAKSSSRRPGLRAARSTHSRRRCARQSRQSARQP